MEPSMSSRQSLQSISTLVFKRSMAASIVASLPPRATLMSPHAVARLAVGRRCFEGARGWRARGGALCRLHAGSHQLNQLFGQAPELNFEFIAHGSFAR